MDPPLSHIDAAFRRACDRCDFADDTGIEEVILAIKQELQSSRKDCSRCLEQPHTTAAELIISKLEECAQYQSSGTDEILDTVVSDLLPELSAACSISRSCETGVRRLLSRYASSCNPRDAVAIALGELAAPRYSLAACRVISKSPEGFDGDEQRHTARN